MTSIPEVTPIGGLIAGQNITIDEVDGSNVCKISAATVGAGNIVDAGAGISVTPGVGSHVTVANTGVKSIIGSPGLNVDHAAGDVTLTNTGVVAVSAGANVTVTALGGGAFQIAATGGGGSSVVDAGAGIGVVESPPGTFTVTNDGVTSNVAGTGIGVSSATGAVTITNDGVTSIIAGAGIAVDAATGAVTVSATGGGGGVNYSGANKSSTTALLMASGAHIDTALVIDGTYGTNIEQVECIVTAQFSVAALFSIGETLNVNIVGTDVTSVVVPSLFGEISYTVDYQSGTLLTRDDVFSSGGAYQIPMWDLGSSTSAVSVSMRLTVFIPQANILDHVSPTWTIGSAAGTVRRTRGIHRVLGLEAAGAGPYWP